MGTIIKLLLIVRVINKVTFLGALFSPHAPYFHLKPCCLQIEEILLNEGWNLIPQYLMQGIHNNYDNTKHINIEGAQYQKKKEKKTEIHITQKFVAT